MNPALRLDAFRKEIEVGDIAHRDDYRIGGDDFTGSKFQPFVHHRFAETGPSEFRADGFGFLAFFPERERFLYIYQGISSAPNLCASAAASQPTFPAPMITTRFPTFAWPALLIRRNSRAGIIFSFPGMGISLGLCAPEATHDEVEFLPEFLYIGLFEPLAQVQVRQVLPSRGRVRLPLRHWECGSSESWRKFPAQFRTHIVDNRLMSLPSQLPGNRYTRGTAADYRNSLPSQGRQFGKFRPQARLSQLR